MGYAFNPFTGSLDNTGASGSTIPGGSDTNVQYNDGGSFGGDVNSTWNKTTKTATYKKSALAATPTSSIVLENETAAVTGSRIQASSAFEWIGKGWRTNSGGASQSINYRAFAIPTTGANNPLASWKLQYSVNGASYADALTYVDKVQDGVSTGLFTITGFGKISANNSSTVDTLQNFNIVNPTGSRTHITYTFGSTIRYGITATDSAQIDYKAAGSGAQHAFFVGSAIGSQAQVGQFYSGGLYVSGAGFHTGVVTAGLGDTTASAKLSSYGSFAVKGQLFTSTSTLDAEQTVAYCDASNSNVCAGTPTACNTYMTLSNCNAHSGVGCSWFAGNPCSVYNGDNSSCTGTSGCTWEQASCSAANNIDQSTCEAQDDAYGGSCAWDTSTCPAQGTEGACIAVSGCSWSTTCSGQTDQSGCEANSCTWNFTPCFDTFLDESSCNAQAGCTWNGSSCEGQFNTSCTGDVCYGNLCNGDFATGNCTGDYGAECQGVASCANLTDDGSSACGAEGGCTWTSGITLMLPAQSSANRSNTSRLYMIKSIGASGNTIIVPNSSDTSPTSTIDGSSSLTLSTQYHGVILHHHNVLANCSAFSSSGTCTPAGCSWTSLSCGDFGTESACNAESGCSWNSGIESCEGTYSGSGGSCGGTYTSARKWFIHSRLS